MEAGFGAIWSRGSADHQPTDANYAAQERASWVENVHRIRRATLSVNVFRIKTSTPCFFNRAKNSSSKLILYGVPADCGNVFCNDEESGELTKWLLYLFNHWDYIPNVRC